MRRCKIGSHYGKAEKRINESAPYRTLETKLLVGRNIDIMVSQVHAGSEVCRNIVSWRRDIDTGFRKKSGHTKRELPALTGAQYQFLDTQVWSVRK